MNATNAMFLHAAADEETMGEILDCVAIFQDNSRFFDLVDNVIDTIECNLCDWPGEWDDIDYQELTSMFLDHYGVPHTMPSTTAAAFRDDLLGNIPNFLRLNEGAGKTPTPIKETTMSIKTNVTLINGYDASEMSDTAIQDTIRALQTEIKSMDDLKSTGSRAVAKAIADKTANIKTLVEVLDSRLPADTAE